MQRDSDSSIDASKKINNAPRHRHIGLESGQSFGHDHPSRCTRMRRVADEIYDTHRILEVNSSKTLWMSSIDILGACLIASLLHTLITNVYIKRGLIKVEFNFKHPTVCHLKFPSGLHENSRCLN
jgi:hypothetical protein